MLTAEDNDRLTRVGPGTPMGNLLRRYWHPVAASAELKGRPTKKVRILCEDLVLYRDKAGTLGLIEELCAHRRVSMFYGIPEHEGLRCPYHGWMYNETGACVDQPGEPVGSTFKDRIHMRAYPVQEVGGLVFAYLGPAPVPLFPQYGPFIWDNAIREIGVTMLPCNWLQCMENSLDPVHLEWLHGYFGKYVEALKRGEPYADLGTGERHVKIGFDRVDHGIVKRRVMQGRTENYDDWRIGHPIVFPMMLAGGSSFQIRVPVDDTHTWHILYNATRPGIPVDTQDPVPMYELPRLEENGDFRIDYTLGQDFYAWYTQGGIAQRHLEKLGVTDIGVILYREMLEEQMQRVEQGLDPIEVYRDPEQNEMILIPAERIRDHDTRSLDRNAVLIQQTGTPVNPNRGAAGNLSPIAPLVRAARKEAAARLAAGEELLPEYEAGPAHVEPGYHREAMLNPDLYGEHAGSPAGDGN